MVATLYENIEIVDYLLLNKKVNINLKDVSNYFISYYYCFKSAGNTVLHLAL